MYLSLVIYLSSLQRSKAIEANKYQLRIFRPLRKPAKKQTIKASKQVPPTLLPSTLLLHYLLSHVQLLLQLQLYSNDSGLAVHAYVEEGGLFGYVIQKSGLQIYCIHT